MNTIEVSFFGPAQDLAGTAQTTIQLEGGASIADLRRALADKLPELGRALSAMRFAVNESFVADDTQLTAGDRVALIPPVSGGEDGEDILVDVVDGSLPVEQAEAFVEGDPASGAVVIFKGVTRRETDGEHGELVSLDYEAYDAMARSQIRKLAQEARQRWSLTRVAVLHRTGRVPVGQLSVVIVVAGGHRGECFDACRWLIDTLKQDVPIWKKDVFEDGFVRWVDPQKSEAGSTSQTTASAGEA